MRPKQFDSKPYDMRNVNSSSCYVGIKNVLLFPFLQEAELYG